MHEKNEYLLEFNRTIGLVKVKGLTRVYGFVCIASSSSSTYLFLKCFFHAQLGLDVLNPEMNPLNISINTAHLGYKPSSSM